MAEHKAKINAAEAKKAQRTELTAKKKAEKEKIAKELAAELANKADKERTKNQLALKKKKEEIKVEIAKREKIEAIPNPIERNKDEVNEPEKTSTISIKKSSTASFKDRNKKRHLYQKPNKRNKGKGPQLKNRIVF